MTVVPIDMSQGVDERIDLRMGPADETLRAMLAAGNAESFDLGFVDANKLQYDTYYELVLQLLRPGGTHITEQRHNNVPTA
eukprot:COSAG01_NODE_1475_length_10189_cov_9.333399_15_plen_81_part_00